MQSRNQPIDLLTGDDEALCDPFPIDYLREQVPKSVSQKALERINLILNVLDRPVVDVKRLRKLCYYGIPEDCKGLRSLCWRILIGYLPADKKKWYKILEQNKQTFQQLQEDFFRRHNTPPNAVPAAGATNSNQQEEQTQEGKKVPEDGEKEPVTPKDNGQSGDNKPAPQTTNGDAEEQKSDPSPPPTQPAETKLKPTTVNPLARAAPPARKTSASNKVDHPLRTGTDSQWGQHFQDQALWEEIEKDTTRTRAEMHFFVTEHQLRAREHQAVVPFRTSVQEERRRANQGERHFDVLSRILFVYGKLNPALKYVQGMNEILAPYYYVFCNDCNPYLLQLTESDSFFCFTIMMADLRDSFFKQMDETEMGIKARVQRLNRWLREVDEEMWQNLQNVRIDPHYYSLRWLLLLLTQEFELFDVLRLWDSLLSHENKLAFFNFICIALLKVRRETCMSDDFAAILESLQKLEGVDIVEVISIANELYRDFRYLEDEGANTRAR